MDRSGIINAGGGGRINPQQISERVPVRRKQPHAMPIVPGRCEGRQLADGTNPHNADCGLVTDYLAADGGEAAYVAITKQSALESQT